MITKVFLIIFVLLLSGCSHRKSTPTYTHMDSKPKNINKVVQKKMPRKSSHPTMRPYVVHGKKYYPTVVNVGSKLHGIASWYGPDFDGKLTSNGETYSMWASTAAHKTLPMNTIVKVTNKSNGKTTVVRINDRGPFVGSRIIDLSKKAAIAIDMVKKGTAPVELEILGFQEDGVKNILPSKELSQGPRSKVMKSYAVQVGSFTRLEGAIITQEKYDGLDGYSTIIKDMEVNGMTLYRVWLTGFKSEQEARDFIASDKIGYSFIVGE